MMLRKTLSKQGSDQLLELNRDLTRHFISHLLQLSAQKGVTSQYIEQVVKDKMNVQSDFYQAEIEFSCDQQIVQMWSLQIMNDLDINFYLNQKEESQIKNNIQKMFVKSLSQLFVLMPSTYQSTYRISIGQKQSQSANQDESYKQLNFRNWNLISQVSKYNLNVQYLEPELMVVNRQKTILHNIKNNDILQYQFYNNQKSKESNSTLQTDISKNEKNRSGEMLLNEIIENRRRTNSYINKDDSTILVSKINSSMVIYDDDGEQLEMEIAQDYQEIINKEYSISFDQKLNYLNQKYVKIRSEDKNKAYLKIIRLLKEKDRLQGESAEQVRKSLASTFNQIEQ